MWNLYLDESGDLGFDFVNKKPSKFFTVENFGVQVADLFSWGVFQKYERKNTKWYDIFKDKIRYDQQFL